MDEDLARQGTRSGLSTVIGFDLGDAETALCVIPAFDGASGGPKPIRDAFLTGGNNQTIIKTIVGYTTGGEILVGFRAAKARNLRHRGLRVGFKLMPTEKDHDYAQGVRDFVNTVVGRLSDPNRQGAGVDVINLPHSKVVLGYPSKWKHHENGRPIEVLRGILQQTLLNGAASLELVPESRGAMVEATESGEFDQVTRMAKTGWVLVVDLGSSTSDFTAVHAVEKKAEPVDVGEELGAKLIDRALMRAMIARYPNRLALESFFTAHPEELARFELACRDFKETYFGAGDVVERYNVIHGETEHQIPITIDAATVRQVLEQEPVITINGQSMSWRAGFAAILAEVKETLAARGVTPITGVVFAGGASLMDFVLEECAAIFPEAVANKAIGRSFDPALTVANGLARWGRIQVRTDGFVQEIEAFCNREIPPRANKMADQLFERIGRVIADEICLLIRAKFDAWQRSDYRTINGMKADIAPSIESRLTSILPQRIQEQSAPLLEEIAKDLAQELKALENKYRIPLGALGGGLRSDLMLSSNQLAKGFQIGDVNWGGNVSSALGSIVGVVTGLVTGVVLLNVVPIVLAIVVNIVGAISATLGGLLFAILTTNPIGWAFLIAIFGTIIFVGAEIKRTIQEKFQEWDLPSAVRKLVGAEKIHREINAKHAEIATKVKTTLSGNAELRAQLNAEITAFFKRRLTDRAEDARILIS